jgi:hypothetical protein
MHILNQLRKNRCYLLIYYSLVLILSVLIAFTQTERQNNFLMFYLILFSFSNLAKHIFLDLIFLIYLLLSLFQSF